MGLLSRKDPSDSMNFFLSIDHSRTVHSVQSSSTLSMAPTTKRGGVKVGPRRKKNRALVVGPLIKITFFAASQLRLAHVD